jgi:hypothetical protein
MLTVGKAITGDTVLAEKALKRSKIDAILGRGKLPWGKSSLVTTTSTHCRNNTILEATASERALYNGLTVGMRRVMCEDLPQSNIAN